MSKISDHKYHLLALFTVVVWGTTFVSTKILLNNVLSPVEIFFMRFVLAYVLIWSISPRRFWANSLCDEMILLAAGVCGGSLYFVTENMALEYAPASNVSLIVCTAPIWTALLLSFFYRNERMTRRQVIGSAIAFVGMILVVLNGRFILQISPKGDLLALSSALLWMIYSLIIKKIGSKYNTIFITRKIFFYGILTTIPIFIIEPFSIDFELLCRPVVWSNILFLGCIASMLCYILWNVVIKHLGVVRTTNYIYINPLVTIVTAALIINERITLVALLGAALILTGMWQAERNR